MSLIDQTLEQYRELCIRVDAKFSEIRANHPASFACKIGCHSCCKPGLTVNALEHEEIARFLAERPGLQQELRELKAANPHKGKRCGFLSGNGECRIYDVRPLVCRSHGAPLQFSPLSAEQFREPAAKPADDKAVRMRDVCPLNFTSEDLSKVPANDVLNLDTLNTLLALLSERAFPGQARRPLAE
jgi:Fe-S-cluster containining protein